MQSGTPGEIYERPASHFVSDFIGMMNALRATALGREPEGRLPEGRLPEGRLPDGCMKVRLEPGGRELVVAAPAGIEAGAPVELMLRPEKVRLNPPEDASLIRVAGTVAHVVYLGAVTYLHVATPDGVLIAMLPNAEGGAAQPRPGQAVTIGWRVADMVCFAPGG